MKIDNTRSIRLDNWGTANSVFGVIFIIVGLFAASLDETWGTGLAVAGLGLLVYAPLLKGFAVLVENAEWELAEKMEAERKAREAEKEE